MVNGSPYKLMAQQAAHVHRQLNCVQQLPVHHGSSFLQTCSGVEFRRVTTTQPPPTTRCRLRNGNGGNSTSERTSVMGQGQRSKRKLNDMSDPLAFGGAEPGDVSSQSAAAPASDMDMTDESEDEMEVPDDHLSSYRGLVLDVAYRPINVVNWQRALCLDILDKAEVLEYYDQVIYSPNRMFFIPAVLKVEGLIRTPKHKHVRLTLNRKNIFQRDKFRCQYCNAHDSLTIDHVHAASKGGKWTWENLVTACSSCNVKKASKTPEEAHMTLIKAPKEPKLLENLPPNFKTYRTLKVHDKTPLEWLDYLPNVLPLFQ